MCNRRGSTRAVLCIIVMSPLLSVFHAKKIIREECYGYFEALQKNMQTLALFEAVFTTVFSCACVVIPCNVAHFFILIKMYL